MDDLALTCNRIAAYAARLKKVDILAAYFRTLDDADLARAARFLCCGPVETEGRKFAVASAVLRDAGLLATGWSKDVWAACHQQVGDTGETISLLLYGRTEGQPMTLRDAEMLYQRIYKLKRTADRVELLASIFRRHKPLTTKFFIKVITGNLRIGLLARQVEEAIAQATGAPAEDVRAAADSVGDLSVVALAARRGTLHQVQPALFHPMEFMLAKPLDELTALADPAEYHVEEKYDGFRVQAHVEGTRVTLFTRGAEDVTAAFPEVVEALCGLDTQAVIDGEVVAWGEGRPLSFNVLQRRIARKQLSPELLAEVPAAMVAYDILYAHGRMLTGDPLEARRENLQRLVGGRAHPLYLAPQSPAESIDQLEQAFHAARAAGNEGLLLKRRGSLYESGKRSGAWLKVKRPYATLDVVITAAEQGHGRRAIYLSDYTFGVRDGDRFVNVGKAYSGLTDPEIRQLNRVLRATADERFGRVITVKPAVVIEVAFDLIQKSARHKSGYSLRFPRIVRWRRDKRPEDADTLDRVRELYEATLQP